MFYYQNQNYCFTKVLQYWGRLCNLLGRRFPSVTKEISMLDHAEITSDEFANSTQTIADWKSILLNFHKS